MESKKAVHTPKKPAISSVPASFGEVIQKYRVKANLNQAELAKKMDSSRSTIVNWENGRNLPSIKDAQNLAVILNIPAYELLCIANEKNPTQHERVMLNSFRQLSTVGQNTVFAMINSILEQETTARDEYLKDNYLIIPQQSTPVAAGFGNGFDDTAPEPVFIRATKLSRRADAIVRVSGDSMEPKYHDGDLVYIVYTQELYDGDDAICKFYNGFIIKRFIGNELFSLNPKRDFGRNHDQDDIRTVGKAIGIVEEDDFPDSEDTDALYALFHSELREFDKTYHRDWE